MPSCGLHYRRVSFTPRRLSDPLWNDIADCRRRILRRTLLCYRRGRPSLRGLVRQGQLRRRHGRNPWPRSKRCFPCGCRLPAAAAAAQSVPNRSNGSFLFYPSGRSALLCRRKHSAQRSRGALRRRLRSSWRSRQASAAAAALPSGQRRRPRGRRSPPRNHQPGVALPSPQRRWLLTLPSPSPDRQLVRASAAHAALRPWPACPHQPALIEFLCACLQRSLRPSRLLLRSRRPRMTLSGSFPSRSHPSLRHRLPRRLQAARHRRRLVQAKLVVSAALYRRQSFSLGAGPSEAADSCGHAKGVLVWHTGCLGLLALGQRLFAARAHSNVAR